jgi:hypothetical protein
MSLHKVIPILIKNTKNFIISTGKKKDKVTN